MDINKLFQTAVKIKASDLHFITGLKPFLRVDGELKNISEEKELNSQDITDGIMSLLTESQQERLKKERELDVSYEAAGGNRFRVNIHYEKENLGMVARIILKEIPKLESITMPAVVYNLLRLQQGLILLTGPTGCGKSTSLASIIN